MYLSIMVGTSNYGRVAGSFDIPSFFRWVAIDVELAICVLRLLDASNAASEVPSLVSGEGSS